MGITKDEMIAKEDGWKYLCDSKGWKCGLCGVSPEQSEKVVYFGTGYCGYCTNKMGKSLF